jgi:hypothetical protein
MSTKRDKRKLEYRTKLDELMDLYVVTPEEFTQIVETKGKFNLGRIPGSIMKQIRSLFNKLVYQ